MTPTLRASLWIVLSLTACGDNLGTPDARGGDGDASSDGRLPTTPTVTSTIPTDGTSLALNASIRATFSEPMDRATLTTSTFTVTTSSGTPVAGTVTYTSSGATFRPGANLASNGSFTATVTTGAKSSFGVALAANKSWAFSTATALATGEPVDLGSAATFAILSKSGISTVPTSVVTGDLGVSPIDSTAITGFSLTAFPTNIYATSTQVTGRVYAANYAAPTPINLTTAIGDMETAFTDAASRAPSVTELGAGNIGGLTLAPGVYKWSSGLLIPTNVMLSGSATDVWVFEIAQNLTVSSGAQVMLAGAVPKNVFWQVSGHVTLDTGSHVEGNVLSQTSVILSSGATLNGRLLAQTAVTLDAATVARPAL